MKSLEDREVHGWCRPTAADEYRHYTKILGAEERARCARFRFEPHRYDYANAHDLLRRSLSRYEPTAPDAWQFASTPQGKPYIHGDDARRSSLTFNVSHTRELAACAIARGMAVGVDVESLGQVDALGIATRYFAPEEVAQLRKCRNHTDQQRCFVGLWCLKEAFIKAVGLGLSQPLNTVAFDLTGPGQVRFLPPLGFSVAEWHFALYDVTPAVQMAIAAHDARPPRFVARLLEGPHLLELRPTRTT